MTTVLAKRDKTFYYIVPIVVLVALFTAWYNKMLAMPVVGTFIIVCAVLSILVAVVGGLIVLPNEVLVKEDEVLIIYNGIFNKKMLNFGSILSVEGKGKETKNGSILLKVQTENGEESISVYQIKDKKTVVETLNNLIVR